MSIRSALGTMLERIGLASRKSRRRRQGIQTANKRAYFFEPLEERQLLSISTWTGASTTDNLWSDAANWNRSGGGAPQAGDQLVFSGSTQTNSQNDLTAGTSFQSIEFQNSNFAVSGNSIALAGNVTVDTGATAEQISLPVTLSGGTTVTVTDSTSNLTMSGVISSAGSQSLAKAGAGTLTLAGTDTYSGGTTISAGRLQLGANNALPTSGTVQMNTVAGVTLDLNNYNQSLGDLSDTAHGGADTITLGSGTLTLNGPSCDDFNGVISGTGGLVINGTVLVDGNNTYSGGTTVNSGAYFSFDYNNVMPAGGAVYIASGGQLDLYGTHQLIGNLTGSGQIISYSGGNAGQLEVCPSGSSSFAGSIQDDGTGDTVSLKVSGGTQILTGANTYTGGTVLSGGTLQLGTPAQSARWARSPSAAARSNTPAPTPRTIRAVSARPPAKPTASTPTGSR